MKGINILYLLVRKCLCLFRISGVWRTTSYEDYRFSFASTAGLISPITCRVLVFSCSVVADWSLYLIDLIYSYKKKSNLVNIPGHLVANTLLLFDLSRIRLPKWQLVKMPLNSKNIETTVAVTVSPFFFRQFVFTENSSRIFDGRVQLFNTSP